MRLGSRCFLLSEPSWQPLVNVDVVEVPVDFDVLKILFKKNLCVVSVEVSGNCETGSSLLIYRLLELEPRPSGLRDHPSELSHGCVLPLPTLKTGGAVVLASLEQCSRG